MNSFYVIRAASLGSIAVLASSKLFSMPVGNSGDVATRLSTGAFFLTHMMHTAAILMGIILLLMAIFSYKNHRDNPKFVPLEKPIVYLVLALALFALPFIKEILKSTNQHSLADHFTHSHPHLVPSSPMVDIDAPMDWEDDS